MSDFNVEDFIVKHPFERPAPKIAPDDTPLWANFLRAALTGFASWNGPPEEVVNRACKVADEATKRVLARREAYRQAWLKAHEGE